VIVIKKILVVEDERNIVDILKFNLSREGFETLEALDGATGLQKALEEDVDLVLLDIMLPEMDGFTVCRKIREKKDIPIIMLTAREEELDKVLGLELGSDDYITKPFSTRELMARIKANLRRRETPRTSSSNSNNKMMVDDLLIDVDRYEVRRGDHILELTLREFELLKFLATQKGQIFTRENLLQKVWGYEYYGDVRTVDVTVRRMREKIEQDPSDPKYIITKRGVGYYFKRDS
jgi:two-component system, OmpR family, response regulator VicR